MRAVHIPRTAGVLPSAIRTVDVIAGVRTFWRRRRRFELMTDICAPVSMRAVTGIPSTRMSRRLHRLSGVSRGFAVQVVYAASPPGAAPSSFRSGGQWGTENGEVGASGTDGAGAMASGWSDVPKNAPHLSQRGRTEHMAHVRSGIPNCGSLTEVMRSNGCGNGGLCVLSDGT